MIKPMMYKTSDYETELEIEWNCVHFVPVECNIKVIECKMRKKTENNSSDDYIYIACIIWG